MKHQSSQFEEILIPPVILAELFGNSIVLIEDEGTISSTKKKPGSLPKSVIIQEPAKNPGSKEVMAEPELPALQSQKINWLGNFQKQVIILVDDRNAVHLGDEELELLGKMLQAVKLSLADIALVNTARQQIIWPELMNQLPALSVIFFGVEPSSIGVPMRFPHFRVQRWSNTLFLYSPSLTTINTPSPDQTSLKKDLWKALQEIFTVG